MTISKETGGRSDESGTPRMMTKILAVDDEPDLEILLRQKFRRQIREGQFDFAFAHDGMEAVERLEAEPQTDVVLTDINMPRMDGLDLLYRLHELNPLTRAVVVSAYGDMANIRKAMNRGAFDFITKPIDFQDLEATLDKTLREVQRAKGYIDGESEAWVGQRLGVSQAHVHGTVTFYTMYKQQPSGKYHIQVCTTLSCMLRGSDELVDYLESKLGIKVGETTPDGKFSLVRVECLGSCGTAPMLQLNDDYHEDLTHEAVDRLLDGLS